LDLPSLDPEHLRAFREQTLYRLVLRARRAENNEMVARIRARGYPDLKPSYPALLANLDSEGANMTALAAKSGITRQAASQQLAEIEARGYVELRPDPADGRAVIVDRTERGRRLLQDALEVVSDLEGEYSERVGRERFDAMRQVLAELLDGIDPAGRLDMA
jgi:DNA-binding MarR family transcriptional regulator